MMIRAKKVPERGPGAVKMARARGNRRIHNRPLCIVESSVIIV